VFKSTNTVDPQNFNLTMYGYCQYALEDMFNDLKRKGYTDKQLKEITYAFQSGLSYATDMMSMTQARYYNEENDQLFKSRYILG
jgi:hypothetical protein